MNDINNKPTKKCFVLMPFKREFKEVYDLVYREVCDANGIYCWRVDEKLRPGCITRDIIQGIDEADIIIADLTGMNPNVFYELGIAHCRGNKTIMTSQELEKLPFDIKSYRVIQYEQSASGLKDLRTTLNATITEFLSAIEYTNNPVQDYFIHSASIVKHVNKIPAISYGCDEVSKYFHRTIIDSWSNEASHETKVECLGVSLAYSWRPLRDLLEKKILPNRPKDKQLSLSLSILDYEWHKFESLNVDWRDSNKRLYVSLNEFLKEYGKEIDVSLFTYRYTPNWHGFLVDDSHLFLSSCLLEKKRGKYVLTVGSNEYEYFENLNNEAFKIKVKQFKNWFSFDNKRVSLDVIRHRARAFSS